MARSEFIVQQVCVDMGPRSRPRTRGDSVAWPRILGSRSRSLRSPTGSSRPTRNAAAIHHLGHSPLPSYREVVEILSDLREILYPGYGRRQNLHMGNVAITSAT